jgi:DNA-binding transcriptional regulator GbsR (MarR family)
MKKFTVILWLTLIPLAFAQAFDWTAIPGAKLCIEVREPGYHDNLYYTPAEVAQWKTLSTAIATVNAEKNKRISDHEAFVKEQSSKVPVKPTKEELELRKADLVKQVEAIDEQLKVIK